MFLLEKTGMFSDMHKLYKSLGVASLIMAIGKKPVHDNIAERYRVLDRIMIPSIDGRLFNEQSRDGLQSKSIRIKDTDDFEVACVLAYVAGFYRASVTLKYPGYHEGVGQEVVVFHEETIARDPHKYHTTQSPDIRVSRFPRDEYLVEFNERIDPSLVSGLEEEIQNIHSEDM